MNPRDVTRNGWVLRFMRAPAQTATDTAKVQAAMPAASAASAYDAQLKQMTTAVTWLIGALAAVGAAMIAGTQLSSIGQLSWSLNRSRLLVAVVSVSAAVGLILLSIGLLYRAQTPTTTDFDRLRKLANKDKQVKGLDLEVHQSVSGDSTLHRGQGDLKTLMSALDSIRKEYYDTKEKEYSGRLAAAQEPDETKRAEKTAEYKRCAEELEVLDTRLEEYRRALLRVAQLDKFLRTRARYRGASRTVLVLSALAGIAFVSFAWAANPPETAAAVVAQRPEAAHMTLTAAAEETFKTELGTTCAAAAANGGGVPVVALSSSPAGIDLIIVPTFHCPKPQRLVISPQDGEVVADRAVIPAP